MKKLFFPTIILLFASCGSSTEEINSEPVSVKYAEGEAIYMRTCVACHQAKGEGVVGAFPPLAKSDYLLADKNRAISQIIYGSSGEMIVNGEVYNTIMPPQGLSDEEVRDVMNYILNAWGNNGGEVTLEDVKKNKH